MNKNIIKILFLVFIMMFFVSCKNSKYVSLNEFEKKIIEAIKISNFQFNDSYIQNVYNLIENNDDFVFIEIGDIWYALALNDYDYSDEVDITNNNIPNGLKITIKANKGDIAPAVDILVDMSISGIKKHEAESQDIVIKLNEALGLRQPVI